MLARVSSIEAFRKWRDAEDQSVEDLVRYITVDKPTKAMVAGTAFHDALENSVPGDYEVLEALGHKFHLPDCELVLPTIREVRAYGQYGGLTVTGKVDCLDGKRVDDHKTTSRFDAERYLAGYQWRFYLDLFGADVFRWNVFELKETSEQEYRVSAPQLLEVTRYPGLHDDCMQLALDYLAFAREHLPDSSRPLN
ncbi:MAG: hypothetical protein ACREPD_05430 [Stenotrophomonas sp.]|uniref:hypothetical protein n=1 Tax=Stenotrophomonas sp. TaxID=69392 RepID=UPI003D6C7824